MSGTSAVVLVDDRGNDIGTADKLEAHREGLRHRACSVFVFDGAGRLLLQRRALHKYHSGGLWSNTCCGHPMSDETPRAGARRRLREEMGFECELYDGGTLLYEADVGNGLIEREYDHLFVGWFEGTPAPDQNEVVDWRWLSSRAIDDELRTRRDRYTAWFPMAWRRVCVAFGPRGANRRTAR